MEPHDFACHISKVDPDAWAAADTNNPKMNVIAARICIGCPARFECGKMAERARTRDTLRANGATTWKPYGIWGGVLYDGTSARPKAIRVSL